MASTTEANRNIPRRLATDAVEALERAAKEAAFRPDDNSVEMLEAKPAPQPIDPIAVGTKASEGVASYITAAKDIEATVASTRKMADAIEKMGTALAADILRQGAAMEKMVANFARLSAGTEQRMADERKHLEEITGGGTP